MCSRIDAHVNIYINFTAYLWKPCHCLDTQKYCTQDQLSETECGYPSGRDNDDDDDDDDDDDYDDDDDDDGGGGGGGGGGGDDDDDDDRFYSALFSALEFRWCGMAEGEDGFKNGRTCNSFTAKKKTISKTTRKTRGARKKVQPLII